MRLHGFYSVWHMQADYGIGAYTSACVFSWGRYAPHNATQFDSQIHKFAHFATWRFNTVKPDRGQ